MVVVVGMVVVMLTVEVMMSAVVVLAAMVVVGVVVGVVVVVLAVDSGVSEVCVCVHNVPCVFRPETLHVRHEFYMHTSTLINTSLGSFILSEILGTTGYVYN